MWGGPLKRAGHVNSGVPDDNLKTKNSRSGGSGARLIWTAMLASRVMRDRDGRARRSTAQRIMRRAEDWHHFGHPRALAAWGWARACRGGAYHPRWRYWSRGRSRQTPSDCACHCGQRKHRYRRPGQMLSRHSDGAARWTVLLCVTRPSGPTDRSSSLWNWRGSFRPPASTAHRNDWRCALSKSWKRRAAAFQAADHTGHFGANRKWPSAGYSRP